MALKWAGKDFPGGPVVKAKDSALLSSRDAGNTDSALKSLVLDLSLMETLKSDLGVLKLFTASSFLHSIPGPSQEGGEHGFPCSP